MDQDVSGGSASPKGDIGVYCRRCGYPLRGLPEDGACPECGHSILESLRAPPDLTQLPARWLERVRIGVSVVLVGWLGVVAPYPVDAVALWLGWRTPLMPVGSIWILVPYLILYGSLLLAGIGLCVATVHDPRLRDFGAMEEIRGVTRFLFGLSSTFMLPGGLFGEPVLFLIGFVFFPFLVLFALKWAYELAARAPIERRPLARVFLWMPIVAIAINLPPVFIQNPALTALGMIAAITAWATTTYVIVRTLGAVSSAVKMLRERERALSLTAES